MSDEISAPTFANEAIEDYFEHAPLDSPQSEVRLLEVLPGTGEDTIVCYIRTLRRAVLPKYEAISYTWGDPRPVRIIKIDGKPLQVGENCWTALRQVRVWSHSVLVWIDAICVSTPTENGIVLGLQLHETFLPDVC